MRLKITLGIIVALALPLQGCGKKGPLTFQAPQANSHASQQPGQPAPAASAPETNK
jgi:predicted small lipoprotein YifL